MMMKLKLRKGCGQSKRPNDAQNQHPPHKYEKHDDEQRRGCGQSKRVNDDEQQWRLSICFI